jgi:thioredoxin reductase (NADPH)
MAASENQTDKQSQVENVMIIGSGPAGLSAALYTARAELNPLLMTGIELGGQVARTNIVENYPGFPDGVGGAELGELFQKQAERFGARIEFDTVTGVDLSKRPFVLKTYSQEFQTRSLIIAIGASPNHLNIPGEEKFVGKGVSYCATCDGSFFKGKPVVVIGGGDSALEEGLFLTRYATKVTIIHRRDSLRAGAILQERALNNEKVSFIWDSIPTEIKGNDAVEVIHLKNVKTNEESDFQTDGVFIFIGHTPNTEIFKAQLELDEKGYIKTDRNYQTSIPGIFAVGEAADARYRQIITSAGMGAAAAIEVTHYLENE